MGKSLAIIPARGGSKRIPGKNIKEFLGKPIIAYSIEVALNSKLFDEVIVSTDDEKISEISKKCGANVPFFRSEKNSNDFSTTSDVLQEVLEKLENEGQQYDYACCIYPTAPFITSLILRKGFGLLKNEKKDVVFPVVSFDYPVWRGLRKKPDGSTEMIWPENLHKRSQDLEKVYHDAGQWYWFNVNTFKEKKVLFTENCASLELPSTEVQDIDEPNDWEIAEMKYELLQSTR